MLTPSQLQLQLQQLQLSQLVRFQLRLSPLSLFRLKKMSEDELAIPMLDQVGIVTSGGEGERIQLECIGDIGPVQGEENESFLRDASTGRNGFIQPLLNSTISVSPTTTALKDAMAVINEGNETTRLLNQFNEIKNLCNSDVDNRCVLVASMLSKDETSPLDAVRKPRHIFLFYQDFRWTWDMEQFPLEC